MPGTEANMKLLGIALLCMGMISVAMVGTTLLSMS